MTSYVLKRLGQSLAAFAIVAVVVFAVSQFAQSWDPPPDLPLREQNVLVLVPESLPASLYLAAFAAALALVIALPLGILSAAYRRSPLGVAIDGLAILARSFPHVALFGIVIWLLLVPLGLMTQFPQGGGVGNLFFAGSLLALFHVAPLMALVRSLAAKGKPGGELSSGHGALIEAAQSIFDNLRESPMVVVRTYFATMAAVILVGSAIVEALVNWPGALRLAFSWVSLCDLRPAAAIALTFSGLVIGVRLLGDLFFALPGKGDSGIPAKFPLEISAEAVAGLVPLALDAGSGSGPQGLRAPGFGKVGITLAVVLLIIVAVIAVAPGIIAPEDPWEIKMDSSFKAPGSPGHLLGADALGQDVYSRLTHGLQRSIIYAVAAVALAAVVGIGLGLTAIYAGRYADAIITTFAEASRSLPGAGLLAFTALLSRQSWVKVVVAASVMLWGIYYRQVRLRGFGTAGIGRNSQSLSQVTRGLAPAVLKGAAVLAAGQIGFVVILQTGIDLVGGANPLLNTPPGSPVLGMIAGEGRSVLGSAPWIYLVPSIAVLILALAFNLLGNWLGRRWGPGDC